MPSALSSTPRIPRPAQTESWFPRCPRKLSTAGRRGERAEEGQSEDANDQRPLIAGEDEDQAQDQGDPHAADQRSQRGVLRRHLVARGGRPRHGWSLRAHRPAQGRPPLRPGVLEAVEAEEGSRQSVREEEGAALAPVQVEGFSQDPHPGAAGEREEQRQRGSKQAQGALPWPVSRVRLRFNAKRPSAGARAFLERRGLLRPTPETYF